MVEVFVLIFCSASLFLGSWVVFGSFTRLSLDSWFIIIRCLDGLERSNALTPCSSSGLLHQPNLRLLLSLNIFSIDQTQRMRKLWAARVRSNTTQVCGSPANPDQSRTNETKRQPSFLYRCPGLEESLKTKFLRSSRRGRRPRRRVCLIFPFKSPVRPRNCLSIALECLQTIMRRNIGAFRGCVAGQDIKYNN